MRKRLEKIFSEQVVVTIIIINAISIGLETVPNMHPIVWMSLKKLDFGCLVFFAAELSFKIWRYRRDFFNDPWRVFDFAVVSIALLPTSGPLSILRTLRILRAFRMISVIPKLRQVVGGLLAAIPGLGAVFGMLILIFYVSSVMATNFFGNTHPQWFGSIGASCYTLFQVMTLESWSMGIVRPIMEEYPWAWIFFVPFILITTFTMLNLFIAVIVNAMQIDTEEEASRRAEESQIERQQLLTEIQSLRLEVQKLYRIDTDSKQ